MTIDQPEIPVQQDIERTPNPGQVAAERAVAIAFTAADHAALEVPEDCAPASEAVVLPDSSAANLAEDAQDYPTPERKPEPAEEVAPTSAKVTPEPATIPKDIERPVPESEQKEQKVASPPDAAPAPELPERKLSKTAVTAAVLKPEKEKFQPAMTSSVAEVQPIEADKPATQNEEPSKQSDSAVHNEVDRSVQDKKSEEEPAELATGGDGGKNDPPAERSTASEGDESPEERAIHAAANEAVADIVWAAAAAKTALQEFNERYPYVDEKDRTPEGEAEKTEAFEGLMRIDDDFRLLLKTSDLWKKATELHPLLEDLRQLEEEYEMAKKYFEPHSMVVSRQRSRVESAKANLKHSILGRENERVAAEARPKGEEWLKIPEGSSALEHVERLFLRLYEPYGDEGLDYMANIIMDGLQIAYAEAGYNMHYSTRYDSVQDASLAPPSLEAIVSACNTVVQKSAYADSKKPLLRQIVEELGSSL